MPSKREQLLGFQTIDSATFVPDPSPEGLEKARSSRYDQHSRAPRLSTDRFVVEPQVARDASPERSVTDKGGVDAR